MSTPTETDRDVQASILLALYADRAGAFRFALPNGVRVRATVSEDGAGLDVRLSALDGFFREAEAPPVVLGWERAVDLVCRPARVARDGGPLHTYEPGFAYVEAFEAALALRDVAEGLYLGRFLAEAAWNADGEAYEVEE